MAAGEMPPPEQSARPTVEDIELVRTWIASGAQAVSAPPKRRWISERDVAERISADLKARPTSARRRLRYVTFGHLHNAGRPDSEIEIHRQALRKLLASLSWRTTMPSLQAIDQANTIYRFDLAEMGWREETWESIAAEDPYAVARSGSREAWIRSSTGTLVPRVRGDWLISAASRPPLYHSLLGIPDRLETLERRLAPVGPALRAGFNDSGVSRHNRVIERWGRRGGGYYWRSYDFQASGDQRNVFEHPLDYTHDGGEIIFSLPNGMQGYMLVDRDGRRIDRAPTTIVVDPSRSDKIVENGLSCMGCHGQGIIDKRDRVRDHLIANRQAFDRIDRSLVPRATGLYGPRALMAKEIRRDQRRFAAASAKVGIDVTAVEPIDFTARRFEVALGDADVAAELEVTTSQLGVELRRTDRLRRVLGTALVGGGTVKRDAFAAAFGGAVRTLSNGIPLASATAGELHQLRCNSFGGAVCAVAGGAFYHGRSVVVDRRLAARMYRRGCDTGDAAGCNGIAFIFATGQGAARSPRQATAFYGKACGMGDARGCHRLGLRLLEGVGVVADPHRGLAFLEQACDWGRGAACEAAANAHRTGRVVRRNRRRSAGLYHRGCEAGRRTACRRLGDQYLAGSGVTIDWLKANRYYRRGCRLGDRRSCLAAWDVIRAVR
jgi:TPR repeat protein